MLFHEDKSSKKKKEKGLSEFTSSGSLNNSVLEEDSEKAKSTIKDEVVKLIQKDDLEATVDVVSKLIRRMARVYSVNFSIKQTKEIAESIKLELSNEGGDLDKLLRDDSVDVVIIERFDKVTIERKGRIETTSIKFSSEDELKAYVDSLSEEDVDWSNPTFVHRSVSGLKISIANPPVSIGGVQVLIRKAKKNVSLDTLVHLGVIDLELKEFFKDAVEERRSFIVTGGTGVGKTTMLGALTKSLSGSLSILSIENKLELDFDHPHVRRWESYESSKMGDGGSLKDLILDSLNFRPDLLVLGEISEVGVFEFLSILNQGYKGSMSTMNASSPEEAVLKMISCASSSKGVTSQLVSDYIVQGVDYIVHIGRLESRKVVVSTISKPVKDSSMSSGVYLDLVASYTGEKWNFQ